jgi:LacI family transcriptional regulator
VATPAITTIRQPLKEMGLQAAEWTLKALDARENGVEEPPQLHKAEPKLVVRMSTSQPPPKRQRRERERKCT